MISKASQKRVSDLVLKFSQDFRTFLDDVLRTSTFARLVVSFGATLVIAISIFIFIIKCKPFTTQSTELLGSFIYYMNLNIANRLSGITIFTLTFLVVFLFFVAFFYGLHEREKEALELVGYCLLPSVIWLVFFDLHAENITNVYWVNLSALLALLACLSLLREKRIEKLAGSTSITLTSFGLSVFIAPALLAFFKSPLFSALLHLSNSQKIYDTLEILDGWLKIFQFIPPLLVLLMFLVFPQREVLKKFVLYPIQIILLLFYCVILPGKFLVGDDLIQFFNFSQAFYIFVLPLFIVGVWDCTRRCFLKKISPISPLPLLALLLFAYLKTNPAPGYLNPNPYDPSNAFEFGMRLPAFWASNQGWSSLFQDVFLPYGMWDYAQFLFAWAFTGLNTAAASTYGFHLFQALILILEFSSVAAFLPAGLAFLICLFAGIGPQSIILIFLGVLLNPKLIIRPAAWLGFWIILCSLTPFARIPQGTICVVASLPAAFWQAVKLFRENRKQFYAVVGLLSTATILIAIWPFGKYFWALIRLFTEFSKANNILTGNSWGVDNRPLIQIVLGNAMIIMPLMAFIASMILYRKGKPSLKIFVAFFLCSFIWLYDWVSISYGFSRTDLLPYERQLTTFMTMLFPLIMGVMAYVPSRVVRAGCISVLLCFGWLWLFQIPATPLDYLEKEGNYPVLAKDEIQNGDELGLPHMGIGRFTKDYLNTESTIKQTLDRVLAPSETFLNLTMDGLHYFSAQRKLVTEHVVYYNYPGDQSQLRAVEALRKNNVRVTLLDPSYYDMSPSSLRTYYLYRYALLRGLPYEIGPQLTLLLPEEYFAKIGATPPTKAQTLQILDKQFPLVDFGNLPVTWGRGYKDLSKDLHLVRELNNRSGTEFELQPPVRGVDAGLLVLDILDVPDDFDGKVALSWFDETLPNEHNQIQFIVWKGTNIIPLDSSPRWLLASSITKVTLIVPPQIKIDISRASLYQRAHIEEDEVDSSR